MKGQFDSRTSAAYATCSWADGWPPWNVEPGGRPLTAPKSVRGQGRRTDDQHDVTKRVQWPQMRQFHVGDEVRREQGRREQHDPT